MKRKSRRKEKATKGSYSEHEEEGKKMRGEKKA